MNRERAKVVVRGAVQGVGFRPFVYRLAQKLRLDGRVANTAQGLVIEIEGAREMLERFLVLLRQEAPARAVIQSSECSFLDPLGYNGFEICQSDDRGATTALILPDLATCADCLREIFDPADRRFRYPFTNCTNCGPRFSIIEALPYDRARTSMKKFPMCAACDREYHDPADRRFHAQPNACPHCGPRLELWDETGQILAAEDAALTSACAAIRAGKILALKGLGGFQLVIDAANREAICRLRQRKQRAEKAFALMVSSLASARDLCRLSELEERLLLSPEAPITLLRRRAGALLPDEIAPGNPNLGLMLPYTPLHHLLLHSLGKPIVATSGNRRDEPICLDQFDALEHLHGIADLFLVHDRPVVRQVDDSIARIMASREAVLRRARGYAPLPVQLPQSGPSILALGAHLKNTVALAVGANVFVSQHLGDLETTEAFSAFVKSTADLPQLYHATPELIACDSHLDYLSTKHAAQFSAPNFSVQHHWAHIASCMAENELAPPVLGVAWDGTGYGNDGTIWGGEFLAIDARGTTRVAHLQQFRLPGGEAAVKEPRRSALGLLHEILGDELWSSPHLLTNFKGTELKPLRQMLERKINAPLTSSAGRFFDAVAALIGLRAHASFEGQAAMELEFAAGSETESAYLFSIRDGSPLVLDWAPVVFEVIEDLQRNEARAVIAAKFHNTLTEMIVSVARKVGQPRVVVSGGCFQNCRLLERTIARLSSEGFRPYWHQRVPPNDGGISLGQIFAARGGIS